MKTTLIAAALLAVQSGAALAHASLVTGEAAVGSTFVAEIRIAHGCDGKATHTVRVVVPEGFVTAKPMPKAGWDLSIETGPYARTYDNHGPQSAGVQAITWSGGALEDWQFDTFSFRALISGDAFKPGETVYIPVVQTCDGGENAWIEVPVEGQERPAHPAPALTLIDGAHAHH